MKLFPGKNVLSLVFETSLYLDELTPWVVAYIFLDSYQVCIAMYSSPAFLRVFIVSRYLDIFIDFVISKPCRCKCIVKGF